MKTWSMHRSGGSCPVAIQGDTLPDAICGNFRVLADEGDIGNCAGYALDRVSASYQPGILGGQGGVEVIIEAHGQDLAHRPASTAPRTSAIWIAAVPADLPEPWQAELVQ